MLEDLTISLSEQQNGVRSIWRLSLNKKEFYGLDMPVSSIISLLKKEFTRLGFPLNIDGITSSTFNENGKDNTFESP